MQLSRATGESMESYITRAGVYRSHLLGVDPTVVMGEAFYGGHLVDHARLTKRDRAMIKTKAGDFTDEFKVTSAMIELVSELDGEPGYAVGQSEPASARTSSSRKGLGLAGGARGRDLVPAGTRGSRTLQSSRSHASSTKSRTLRRRRSGWPRSACGQFGHWSRECPTKVQAALVTRSRMLVRTGDGGPNASQTGGVVVLPRRCFRSFAAGAIHEGSSVCSASSQHPARSYHVLSTVSMALHDVCWSLKQLAFKVIVDIGCMRSMVGVGWATEVLNRWRDEGGIESTRSRRLSFWGQGSALQSRPRRVRRGVCGRGGGVRLQRGGGGVSTLVFTHRLHATWGGV